MQIDFAAGRGVIAAVPQQGVIRGLIDRIVFPVVTDTAVVVFLPGRQAGAGGRAQRGRDYGVGEADAALRQPVKIGHSNG